MIRGRRSAFCMSLFALAGLALTACGDDDTTTAKGVEADVADVADATVEEHEYAYEVTGTLPSGGTLRVRNTGKEFHMMGLGKLKAGKTFDDAKAALFSDDQADDGLVYDQVAMPGHFTAPGSDVRVTLPSLEPGTYMMACFINVAGEETAHFTRGMVNQIEVVAGDARAPKPDATYVASKGKAMTGPATLKAGRRVLKIEAAGDGAGDLEPGIFMINPGTTVEQFGEALKFFDEGPLPVDAASRVPGRIIIGMFDFGDQPAVYLDVDFDPGTYVLTAEDSDVENTPTVPVEMIQITVS